MSTVLSLPLTVPEDPETGLVGFQIGEQTLKKNKVTKWTDSAKLNHIQQGSCNSPHRDQGHFNNGFLEKAPVFLF